MNPRILAVILGLYAACALLGIVPVAVLAARAGRPGAALIACATALAVAGVLANAAADLWGAAA